MMSQLPILPSIHTLAKLSLLYWMNEHSPTTVSVHRAFASRPAFCRIHKICKAIPFLWRNFPWSTHMQPFKLYINLHLEEWKGSQYLIHLKSIKLSYCHCLAAFQIHPFVPTGLCAWRIPVIYLSWDFTYEMAGLFCTQEVGSFPKASCFKNTGFRKK